MTTHLYISMNDRVQVRLTAHGLAHLQAEHEALQDHVASNRRAGTPFKRTAWAPPETDADGWSTWTLWVLIAAFGPRLTLTAPNYFALDIRIPIDVKVSR